MEQTPESPEKIVLVEDSPSQAAMIEDLLVENGYAVEVCETGEAGLEAIRARRPNLALLDVQLPGMDGFHVCRAIRDDPATFDLPVIMLTTRTEVPLVLEGLTVGADDYVGKSEDMRTLLARIRRLLDRTREFKRLSAQDRLSLLRKASDTLSHGIKNPLQVVFLSLEVLKADAPDDAGFQPAVDELDHHLAKMVRLLKNVEQVSKIASENFVAREQMVDIEKALAEAERMAREAQEPAGGGGGDGR
ncbi:MAG: response regulator [Candidatus Wallbacteria bacterium]|nr:response regulator [Candidatus Wallbacteria bacterium]